jgi:hypothetical protein
VLIRVYDSSSFAVCPSKMGIIAVKDFRERFSPPLIEARRKILESLLSLDLFD